MADVSFIYWFTFLWKFLRPIKYRARVYHNDDKKQKKQCFHRTREFVFSLYTIRFDYHSTVSEPNIHCTWNHTNAFPKNRSVFPRCLYSSSVLSTITFSHDILYFVSCLESTTVYGFFLIVFYYRCSRQIRTGIVASRTTTRIFRKTLTRVRTYVYLFFVGFGRGVCRPRFARQKIVSVFFECRRLCTICSFLSCFPIDKRAHSHVFRRARVVKTDSIYIYIYSDVDCT